MISARLLAALLLPLLQVVSAAKDDSYYMPGSGNPNVKEKMYWKDADNVLQDLSKFSALYVQYSHCAWTWMQMDEADNDVDENDYWYMGKVPPMGANVAYSLYGSLKGESFSGCNEKTFINSFYTNTGFQDFAQAMYYAGESGFSSYSYDDDSSGGISAGCSGGYGVGCDATYGFAVHSYSTDLCNPEKVNGVKDPLYDLNSAFAASTCVKIYDSSSYSGYSEGTALQLLSYSSACFYQNYYSPDGECPDPYGKIKYYRQNFANGLQRTKRAQPYEIYTHELQKGKKLVSIGLALVAVAGCLLAMERRKARNVKKCKHSLDTSDADGLVKSAPGEEEHRGTGSYKVFFGGVIAPPDRVGENLEKDSTQALNDYAPQDDHSYNGVDPQFRQTETVIPAPADSMDISPPPPAPPAPVTAMPTASVPPPIQMSAMPPPPPPQFQLINPSPLASRDESLLGQPGVLTDHAPHNTDTNLSLLANALQPMVPPTEATSETVSEVISEGNPDDVSEPVIRNTEMTGEMMEEQTTESTASLEPTNDTGTSEVLQDLLDASQAMAPPTVPEPSIEESAEKEVPELNQNSQDEILLSRASMDAAENVVASPSRESAGEVTTDSSVLMDMTLSDKMDAALESKEQEDELLHRLSAASSSEDAEADTTADAEADAVVVSHDDASKGGSTS